MCSFHNLNTLLFHQCSYFLSRTDTVGTVSISWCFYPKQFVGYAKCLSSFRICFVYMKQIILQYADAMLCSFTRWQINMAYFVSWWDGERVTLCDDTKQTCTCFNNRMNNQLNMVWHPVFASSFKWRVLSSTTKLVCFTTFAHNFETEHYVVFS